MAVLADLAECLYPRIGLCPFHEGAFQPAAAGGESQPFVNALDHGQRAAFTHHQLRHFGQTAVQHFGLPRHLRCFGFNQRNRKHLGDVIHHRLQQQHAPVFAVHRIERAAE